MSADLATLIAEERAYRRQAEKAREMALRLRNSDDRDAMFATVYRFEAIADRYAAEIAEGGAR